MKYTLIFGTIIILIVLVGFFLITGKSTNVTKSVIAENTQSFSHFSPKQFNQEIATGKYTLIDVRTVDEYKAGHLKNAKQADYYETQKFSNYLDTLDKKASYLIYCRSGRRSGEVLKIMQNKGFSSVNDLAGGYNAWVASGFSTEK